jgi:aromatic ring-opening dioxygenase catalytic subunit (LigB family)
MVDFLAAIAPTLPVPSAILVISAHWEEASPTITSGEFPPLIYDYYGFPEESYAIQYPAPGNPPLAEETLRLLTRAGIEARLDGTRGFDHGLFVPLKIMFPAANIPCIQLSLVSGLEPAAHLGIGRALSGLRTQNVLVLGSGFSFHNMQAFFSSQDASDPRNEAFHDWLGETCTNRSLTREEREQRLTGWEAAPHARYCHPREEHLLPLHVCCGLAGTPASIAFEGEVLGKRALALRW